MSHGFLEKVYEPRPLVMTEAEKAWLACAIDAEGSIVFQTYQTPKSKYRRWRVGVRIGNTSLKFLRDAKRIALYGEIHKAYGARKRCWSYLTGKGLTKVDWGNGSGKACGNCGSINLKPLRRWSPI